jgi:IS5 family transposase
MRSPVWFITSTANTADVTEVDHLLHGHETDVFADAGYVGVQNVKSMKTAV